MSEGHSILPSSKCMTNIMIVADCDFCGQKTVSTLTFYKLKISNHFLLRLQKVSIDRIYVLCAAIIAFFIRFE